MEIRIIAIDAEGAEKVWLTVETDNPDRTGTKYIARCISECDEAVDAFWDYADEK